MAVVTLYGDERGKAENNPRGFADHRKTSKAVQVLLDKGQFAAGNTVASLLYLGRLPSNAIILPGSKVYFDDFGGTTTLDIGDLTDDDSLATDIDVSGAAGSADLLEVAGIEDYGKELWELMGKAEDPHDYLDIIAKVATADVTNAADVVLYVLWT